ncbi:MAG TPA: sterol desaturase family protein [Acidimicrobiia bacterium]|nr:sterol desaturase family protein [Acidimicrobiia bacterium]
MSFLMSVAALTVVYLVVARLERRPTLRFRALPAPRPYLATDLAWYSLAIAATALSVFVLRPQLAKLEIGPLHHVVINLPLAAQFLLAAMVFDFVSFAVHVGLHRSNVLWNVHKVHHSSLHLDGFATTRTHMFENLLRFVPGQAVLFLIGMPVSVVAPTVALAAIYGVSNHSNLRVNLSGLEAIFVTPRLHRRHHVPATTQHNFGAIFTFWDRAFGTLLRADTMPHERYGVPGEVDTFPQHFAAAFREPIRQVRQQPVQAA